MYEAERNWSENTITWQNYGYAEAGGVAANVTSIPKPNSDLVALNSNTSFQIWEKFDVTNSIKKHISNPSTNTGFIVVMDGWASVNYSSSENSNTSLRPKLVITYEGGTPVPEIEITSHDDSRVLLTGGIETITWTSEEISGKLKIELLKSQSSINTLSGNESDDGSYSWILLDDIETGNDYSLKISSVDDPTVFSESGTFTIIKKRIDDNHVLVDQSKLTIESVSSEEISAEDGGAINLLDGYSNTIWHSKYSTSPVTHPHEVIIKLDTLLGISGVVYSPRENGLNGIITDYTISLSKNGSSWINVKSGNWNGSSEIQYCDFISTGAQYIKLISLGEIGGGAFSSCAELNIYHDSKFEETNNLKYLSDKINSFDFYEKVGNTLIINGIDNGEIRIFSISGKMITQLKLEKGRVFHLDLNPSSLPKGVYVLKSKIHGVGSKITQFIVK